METKIDLSFYPLNKSYSKVEIGNFRQSNHGDVSDKVRRKMFILHAFLTSATVSELHYIFFFELVICLFDVSVIERTTNVMFAESQAELLPFLQKRGYSMGQVLGAELGNNLFSNFLGLDDPINSPNVFLFPTYRLDFSHVAPRALINLWYKVCFKQGYNQQR